MLPVDYGGSSTDPHDAAAEPVFESIWIEPYPDEMISDDDGPGAPEARYEQRESLELAFVAALQHLPPNQRAALIMSEVLGFSAKEMADTLETSTASINSALQRARKLLDERTPERSQQASLRALGDDELNDAVDSYMRAMEQGDVESLVSMLSEDASWSMPPQAAWFAGRDAIAGFLAANPFEYFKWKLVPIRANGQAAVGCYSWDESRGAYVAHAINVLSFDGSKVSEIVTFLDVTRRGVDDPRAVNFYEENVFKPFGLPSELPG